jgi:hypothetical protein
VAKGGEREGGRAGERGRASSRVGWQAGGLLQGREKKGEKGTLRGREERGRRERREVVTEGVEWRK